MIRYTRAGKLTRRPASSFSRCQRTACDNHMSIPLMTVSMTGDRDPCRPRDRYADAGLGPVRGAHTAVILGGA